MILDYESEKARTLLKHLAQANQKQFDEELAKKKLKQLIKQKDIGAINLVEIEKRFETEQSEHKQLMSKIGFLENKIGAFVKTAEAKEQRIKDLEEKIQKKHEEKAALHKQKSSKSANRKLLRRHLGKIEKAYAKALKSRKHSKEQLLRVKQKIDLIKQKLKK